MSDVDMEIHGLVESRPPQTHCGLSTTNRRATTDPFRVTCKPCRRIMGITQEMPALSADLMKKPGRPNKKRSIFGL